MGDVTALHGNHVATQNGEANEEIIAALEDLLEKAKSGHLRAIAWCTYTTVDTMSSGWHQDVYGFHLAAAIMALNHEYASAMTFGHDAIIPFNPA